MVSRVSIDTLKTHFREDVYVLSLQLLNMQTDLTMYDRSKEDWQLIVQLKNKLDVV